MQQRDTLPRLRASLDSNDTFVSGGHRIMKTAGATRHAARMKRVPVWALDDDKIKQLIINHFPRFQSDIEQRRLAARTVRIIHLYYRVGATVSAVAEELNMTEGMVKRRLHLIRKAMSHSLKPAHRPKKVVSIQETNGSNGDDSHITL